ncbi:hypothetical protein TNIN_176721 [Trichonephila inaurata madagascariensis]|uniref:Uncharacterized protein n=1 Tax=Trichonephila inaurata madagascariensis TaxID=2747483 RepID=A0A8X6Y0M3_9ARAC|nr:hypothetical protein TNIN_176721 [Trichonephila inaurata madagascariensis]
MGTLERFTLLDASIYSECPLNLGAITLSRDAADALAKEPVVKTSVVNTGMQSAVRHLISAVRLVTSAVVVDNGAVHGKLRAHLLLVIVYQQRHR